MIKRLAFIALVLSLAASSLGVAFAAPADYDIANGHFFTQTGGNNETGFAVRDAGTDSTGKTLRFWSEFKALGGVNTLGYPISRPYSGPGGFVYQAFQRGVLQWRPDQNRALLANTFEILQSAGQDQWLRETKGISTPVTDDGSGGDYQKAVQTRLGWLTEAAISSKYMANPNPGAISGWNRDRSIELYGLPMAKPEKFGPFVSQRFQRIAFQLWVESVPGMPGKGTVVGVLGGDLLKEAGQLPGESTTVQPAGGGDATVVVPVATPVGGTAPTATPVPAAAPTATPYPANVPSGNYPFRVDAIRKFNNCGTTYMWGYVYNNARAPINGMSVKTWNDFGNDLISGSGSKGDGYWDRIIKAGVNPGRWYAAIVDGSGNISSPTVTIDFNGSDCNDPNQGVQVVQVDFIQN